MKNTGPIYDAIILGAGGAGFMCAMTAARRGKSVLLLDHADRPGKKILISGGGRCNFTNLDARAECYLSRNPHFVKSALARYSQHDFIELINRHDIDWHEKTLGQLFCDGSAKQIVDMFTRECAENGVFLKTGCNVAGIVKGASEFSVETSHGTFRSHALVVATGGPSIPKLGATGFAYEIARQFKIKVVEPRPALVPLTLGKEEALFSKLSGVATDTCVSTENQSFEEAALFTHKGLSGPAILQISSYWKPGSKLLVDFLPELESDWLIKTRRNNPKTRLKSALSRHLPERLAETLAAKLDNSGQNLADFKDKQLSQISEQLANWTFNPNGTEGFAKAEVTIGGISTTELSSRTMEANNIPGLYFIGECVDVTGWLGGYNFQWAWSSGYVAGECL